MAMVGGIPAALGAGRNDPGFLRNGPLAGLLAVCAGSAVMHPIGALVVGAVAGAMFVWTFTLTQNRWQRPTNENTKGLIRHYLPKGTELSDLSGISQRQPTQIATALNTRPRKSLRFRTPQEVMAQQITQLCSSSALQS